MEKKTIIISIVTILLLLGGLFFGITYTEEDINKISTGVETVVDIIENATIEIPETTLEDEKSLEVQETEAEGFELQGEIAYNGSGESPEVGVGEYKGLTYYSQIDTRWKDLPYTSTNNSTQTMGSSACGPTCGAMVVSSIKGEILPTKMADLYVEYGYRSANNGTYWSAFRWTADIFDIEYKEVYKLDDVKEFLKDNWICVTACGNGLFTTGGHFVTLVGIEGDVIKVYDPYLYSGKFNISTRRGKATVNGNTVYVTTDNFRNYANYGTFFCFKNNREKVEEVPAVIVEVPETKIEQYEVCNVQSFLNVREGAGINYNVIDKLYNGNKIDIFEIQNGWAKIGEDRYVFTDFIKKIQAQPEYILKRVTARSGLNVRSGPGTNYNKITAYSYGTTVKVYEIKNGWAKGTLGYMYAKYLK